MAILCTTLPGCSIEATHRFNVSWRRLGEYVRLRVDDEDWRYLWPNVKRYRVGLLLAARCVRSP